MPPVDILKAVNLHPIDRAIPLSGQGRNYSAIVFFFFYIFHLSGTGTPERMTVYTPMVPSRARITAFLNDDGDDDRGNDHWGNDKDEDETKMKMKTRTRMKNEQILTRMGTLIHCQNSKPQISMRFPAMRVT